MLQKKSFLNVLFIFILSANTLFSQEIDTLSIKIKYTPAFKFEDGIFLNFDRVLHNKPVSKSQIITSLSLQSPVFFEEILKENDIKFIDKAGNTTKINISEIWGYSNKGVLFINYTGSFNRIPGIASLTHFSSYVTVSDIEYEPYGYSGMQMTPATRTELRQYLLNFETGEIFDYQVSEVEILLMKDTELYAEFSNLSKRNKRKLMYLYVRKFNDKHPVFLYSE